VVRGEGSSVETLVESAVYRSIDGGVRGKVVLFKSTN